MRGASWCLQLVGWHARAADGDLEGGGPHVRNGQPATASKLADDGAVSLEARIAQQMHQVLATPRRRLVQADGDDDQLAWELLARRLQHPDDLGGAAQRPLHVGGAAAVDSPILD